MRNVTDVDGREYFGGSAGDSAAVDAAERRDRWARVCETITMILDLATLVDCDHGGAKVEKATDERADVAFKVTTHTPEIGHGDPVDQIVKHDAALSVRLGLTSDDYYKAEVVFGF